MPIYEYRCQSCGHEFEDIQSMDAPKEQECAKCHNKAKRILSLPAKMQVQWEDVGWGYTRTVTDGKKEVPEV